MIWRRTRGAPCRCTRRTCTPHRCTLPCLRITQPVRQAASRARARASRREDEEVERRRWLARDAHISVGSAWSRRGRQQRESTVESLERCLCTQRGEGDQDRRRGTTALAAPTSALRRVLLRGANQRHRAGRHPCLLGQEAHRAVMCEAEVRAQKSHVFAKASHLKFAHVHERIGKAISLP